MLLERAIGKSKTLRRESSRISANSKMQCRTDSLTMVTIIVPNVLSFLYLMAMTATMCWLIKKIMATTTKMSMVNGDGCGRTR